MEDAHIIRKITDQYLNDRLAELTKEFDSALKNKFLPPDIQKCVWHIHAIRFLVEIPQETAQLVERAWKFDYMASNRHENIRPTNKFVHNAFMKAIDAMKPYMRNGDKRSTVNPLMRFMMDKIINELNAHAKIYEEKIKDEERNKRINSLE